MCVAVLLMSAGCWSTAESCGKAVGKAYSGFSDMIALQKDLSRETGFLLGGVRYDNDDGRSLMGLEVKRVLGGDPNQVLPCDKVDKVVRRHRDPMARYVVVYERMLDGPPHKHCELMYSDADGNPPKRPSPEAIDALINPPEPAGTPAPVPPDDDEAPAP